MTRFVVVSLLVAIGCQRGDGPPVTIVPEPTAMLPDVPSDPFGTPGPAYDRLLEVTNTARTMNWSGNVEELAGWLEKETQAVEQSRALMKALRLGPMDVYSVANGRVALLYEHIALTLVEAQGAVKDKQLDYEWVGQEALLWKQANGFWARCARGCTLAGPYLDAWEMRCLSGVKETEARIQAENTPKSPRQPK